MSIYKKHLRKFIKASPQYIVKLEDFELGDTIGKGGFGEVRRATHKKTGRDCAIKTIFSERLEGNKLRRYIGENETMSKCDNMFLVPLVGFTANPPYAIVTQFMPNGSLNRFVRNVPDRILSGTQLTAIAMGIAYGMIHLHKRGIIHRDLKAANIMLDERLFPRIGDFGIARFATDEALMTAKIGTPNYMAPELIVSHEYDEKVDVYSYAMILYEMSQNCLPFKSMKMSEIFDYLKRDKRPPFYQIIPQALQRLIEACWATDPTERPSFEQIFDLFAKGEVSFGGTRRSDIEKFCETIKNDERIREKKNADSEDDYQYYSADEGFHNFGGGMDWNPTDKPFYETSDDEEEEYYEEEEYDLSEDDDDDDDDDNQMTAEQILSAPFSPNFIRVVDHYSSIVTPSTFFSFYRPLSSNMNRKIPPASLKAIIKCFHSMMKRDKQFIPLFNQARFFSQVPTDNKDIINDVIGCFACLFIEYPNLVNRLHNPAITSLFRSNPDEMIVLYSFYVKKPCYHYNDPWPVLDNLLSFQKIMLNKPHGYLYLSIFSYLITTSQRYAEGRSMHVRPIFLSFVNSKVTDNVKAAYDGLSKLFTDYMNIDFTKLATHLRNPDIWRSALSLLIRIEDAPPSKNLISALISLADKSPKVWIALLHMSNSPEGAKLLYEDLSWMDNNVKYSSECLKLFLVLFREKEYRAGLTSNPQFYSLMKSCISRKNKKAHTAIATILRRIPINDTVIGELEKNGFFKAYIECAEKSKKPKMMKNVLILFDSLARNGYSKDYLRLIPILSNMLNDKENVNAATTVIVTLSFHKPCAEEFAKMDLVEYFKGLSKFEEYRKIAATFLTNIGAA